MSINIIQNYLVFTNELEQNNNKIWFDDNRDRYKKLSEDYKNWIGELIFGVSEFDDRLRFLTPNECTFRINRDYRFSKNKEPYKTHISGGFNHNGKTGYTAGYYFEISIKGMLMVAGGQYWVEPDVLYRIRREIDSNPMPLQDIVQNPDFVDTFGGLSTDNILKTVPKGFDKNSLAIELLRYKNYIATCLVDINRLDDEQIKKIILEKLKTVSPLVKYLRTMS